VATDGANLPCGISELHKTSNHDGGPSAHRAALLPALPAPLPPDRLTPWTRRPSSSPPPGRPSGGRSRKRRRRVGRAWSGRCRAPVARTPCAQALAWPRGGYGWSEFALRCSESVFANARSACQPLSAQCGPDSPASRTHGVSRAAPDGQARFPKPAPGASGTLRKPQMPPGWPLRNLTPVAGLLAPAWRSGRSGGVVFRIGGVDTKCPGTLAGVGRSSYTPF